MPKPEPVDPPGVPARRAALRLLDAVLRQGLPLEAAIGDGKIFVLDVGQAVRIRTGETDETAL